MPPVSRPVVFLCPEENLSHDHGIYDHGVDSGREESIGRRKILYEEKKGKPRGD